MAATAKSEKVAENPAPTPPSAPPPEGQKVEDTPAPTPPPAPPPAPPPVAAVVETPKTPAPSPPPVWTRQSAVDDDPDRQALARLGLSSRPLEPSVLAVQPPGWLADGWRMIAMVENKPPFQSLATLDHCLKVLVRQAGDDALAGVQQCAHGFSTAGSYHAQHCVALECLLKTTVSKAAHRKSARSYQLALYQKLCVGYKKTHHFEQAIELGKHHLVLAKQLKDPSAQIVSGRNLSNALLSKRTTMVVGARRPLDAWRIQDEADKALGDANTLASSLNAVLQLRNTAAGEKAHEARQNSQHAALGQQNKHATTATFKKKPHAAKGVDDAEERMKAAAAASAAEAAACSPRPPSMAPSAAPSAHSSRPGSAHSRGAASARETAAEVPDDDIVPAAKSTVAAAAALEVSGESVTEEVVGLPAGLASAGKKKDDPLRTSTSTISEPSGLDDMSDSDDEKATKKKAKPPPAAATSRPSSRPSSRPASRPASRPSSRPGSASSKRQYI